MLTLRRRVKSETAMVSVDEIDIVDVKMMTKKKR